MYRISAMLQAGTLGGGDVRSMKIEVRGLTGNWRRQGVNPHVDATTLHAESIMTSWVARPNLIRTKSACVTGMLRFTSKDIAKAAARSECTPMRLLPHVCGCMRMCAVTVERRDAMYSKRYAMLLQRDK